jgi:hypothetical protein
VVVVGAVVEVVVPDVVVVVGAMKAVVVVVGVAASLTISSTDVADGGLGVTPAGSKAITTRMYSLNLIVVELVVTIGFFWLSDDQ